MFTAGIPGDAVQDQPQGRAARRGWGEPSGELRLPARPTQVHHQPARGAAGEFAAVVLLDERECEVHARGDASRCGDVTVAHEDAIRLHYQQRVSTLQSFTTGPMRRDAPP